jgi:hypothetical protein
MARCGAIDVSDLRAQALAARKIQTKQAVTRDYIKKLLSPGSFKLYLRAVDDWAL